MKILIVTNLYPPHYLGGYELRCAQVAEHLRRIGHDVRVVTSSFRIDGGRETTLECDDSVNGIPVARFLHFDRNDQWRSRQLHYLSIVRRQVANGARFKDILDTFKPDVVSWWNLQGVTKAILGMTAPLGIPSVLALDDAWLIREFGPTGERDLPFWFDFWAGRWGPRPVRPILRRPLAWLERRVQRLGIPTRAFGVPPCHALFPSEFRRHEHEQAGFLPGSSEVIYGGVSPQAFRVERSTAEYASGPLRLLYAGFVEEKRGLHTVIEAIGLMPPAQRDRIHLSVAGQGPVSPDLYVKKILSRVQELGISEQVTFLGRTRHDDMPDRYRAHHVLVFSSMRPEGMPMTMLEAMCAGCAVVTTGSGGAIELAERADLPLFPRDHAFALARLLSSLEQNRSRVAEIGLRAQRVATRDFTFERMTTQTADAIASVAEAARLGRFAGSPGVQRLSDAVGRPDLASTFSTP
jgi:glycosyltransferase involved in cell wall biosynthesis